MHTSLKGLSRLCAAALISCAAAGACHAEGAVITLDNTTTMERDSAIVDATATDPQRSKLVLYGRSVFTLGYRKQFDNGHVLSFGQGVEGEVAPDNSSLDRLEWKTTAQYQFDLDEARKWQLRLQGEYTHNRSRDEVVFDRVRAGALLRYRHDAMHATRARLRFGYRDQNDALFTGFDQAEYLLEIGHDWRPKKDRTNLSVTAYTELRRADADKFSYDEFGLRLAYRHPVSDDFELTGRLSGFVRDYGDAFSSTDPTRHDKRLQVQVDGAYKLSDRASLVGYLGWETNSSNIAVRDYSGPLVGIQFKINLGRWDL